MNLTFFQNLLRSRLLRPVFVVLLLVALVQLLVSQWLIGGEVRSLAGSVESSLEAGRERVSQEFSQASASVDQRLQAMQQEASRELTRQLEEQLDERQAQIADNLRQAVIAEAQGLADAMAAVAAPLIWDRDTPKLTGLVELVDARESVLFAAYFDQYGERLTRYVDRTDPRVKALMAAGEGRGAVGKVLDAATRDPNVVIITADIAPQGSAIGQLKLGLSTQAIAEDMQQLEAQFDATVAASAAAVSDTLERQTADVSQQLQARLAEIEASTGAEIQATVARIGEQAASLSATLSSFSIGSNLVLLVLVALILGAGVLVRINRLDAAIWRIAEGDADLRKRVELGGRNELTRMADGINQFIARTQAVVSQVNSAAGTAERAASEQRQASSEAVQVVHRQQAEIDQVSTTVSEISGSIQEVAENIQQVASSVQDINAESDATANISRQARTELDAMVAEVKAAATVVAELDRQSEEIGSVLSVIGTIADQTNLLALNAAIEAARAGESGRGFAVVADEVRNLARKTQHSTTEIRDIIDRLQAGSRKAVASIEQASGRVAECTRQFHAADEHIEQISGLLGELQGRAVTISAAAEEQSTQAHQISANVMDMARSAEATVAAIQRSDNSSQGIGTAVSELRHAAGQFRV
ncbi:MAG: HAMP domain-containing methyl-accepting chemotaxis protein [Marinobacter sp.]|uniref:methyl-accepting chemotaxis protein n=1 Tax=Marinobacter sp. TaxID=50741 RepID=UPI00299D4098|nr:HAMP domain-containing methyl-accepting chemotaxis protein [Marinobacter sp.]MDX1633515.1 HAMP domain-containing methyl-accepting chemotaxis protein [Marinobacter sp.]